MVPLTGHAEVPQSINYQGLLTGSDGNPIPDGDYEMSFAIYDAPTDGISLWTESQTVTVTNGRYNVILGQPGNLLDPDDFERELYLGVTVGADAEMMPRQKLISTPFAMKAAKADDADTLDNMDSLDFAFSSHDHPLGGDLRSSLRTG